MLIGVRFGRKARRFEVRVLTLIRPLQRRGAVQIPSLPGLIIPSIPPVTDWSRRLVFATYCCAHVARRSPSLFPLQHHAAVVYLELAVCTIIVSVFQQHLAWSTIEHLPLPLLL